MTSKAAKQIGHRFQRVEQMKRRDAAARPLRLPVLFTQHENGAVESLHQTAGDNAHHATMPIEPENTSTV